MQLRFPAAWSFLNKPAVRQMLSNRCALRRWGGSSQFKWYGLFEIGPYSFSPFKVVYRGQVATDFVAAVMSQHDHPQLGTRLIIPDQTVNFVPCESEFEAYYLCGLFNSSFIRLLYRCLNYKHPGTYFVQSLRIPVFSPANPDHMRLAEAARNIATALRLGAEKPEVDALENTCDERVGSMYGLDRRALDAVRGEF